MVNQRKVVFLPAPVRVEIKMNAREEEDWKQAFMGFKWRSDPTRNLEIEIETLQLPG